MKKGPNGISVEIEIFMLLKRDSKYFVQLISKYVGATSEVRTHQKNYSMLPLIPIPPYISSIRWILDETLPSQINFPSPILWNRRCSSTLALHNAVLNSAFLCWDAPVSQVAGSDPSPFLTSSITHDMNGPFLLPIITESCFKKKEILDFPPRLKDIGASKYFYLKF